jgi:hypothetical protein
LKPSKKEAALDLEQQGLEAVVVNEKRKDGMRLAEKEE